MSKVTKWFPAHIKPVHIGWYETKRFNGNKSAFKWWFDGEKWKGGKDDFICNEQNRIWRGLAKKP